MSNPVAAKRVSKMKHSGLGDRKPLFQRTAFRLAIVDPGFLAVDKRAKNVTVRFLPLVFLSGKKKNATSLGEVAPVIWLAQHVLQKGLSEVEPLDALPVCLWNQVDIQGAVFVAQGIAFADGIAVQGCVAHIDQT